MPNISIPARDFGYKGTQYFAFRFNFNVPAGVRTIGTLPAGAILINAGVVVLTAFNAGTTNTLDMGTGLDKIGFATDLALGTIGRVLADELGVSNDLFQTADTPIVFEYKRTGTAPTAGDAIVFYEFLTI